MKSFGHYFRYHFNSALLRGIIYLAAMLVITFGEVSIRKHVTGINGDMVYTRVADFGAFPMYLVILSLIIPIFELNQFNNRRYLDTAYSLPISRIKMTLAHWLTGVIHIFVICAVCLLACFAILSPLENARLIYLVPFGFLELLLLICVYTILSFFIVKTNTLFDAVAICGGWYAALALIFEFIDRIFGYTEYHVVQFEQPNAVWEWIVNFYGNTIEAWFDFSYKFESLISNNKSVLILPNYYVMAIFTTLLCALAFVFLLWTSKKKKAHEAGGMTVSWIGYKTLIPLATVFYILMSEFNVRNFGANYIKGWEEINFFELFIPLGMFVAFVIYRRSLKIKRSDIIWISAISVVVIVNMIYPSFITNSVIYLINPKYEKPRYLFFDKVY